MYRLFCKIKKVKFSGNHFIIPVFIYSNTLSYYHFKKTY